MSDRSESDEKPEADEPATNLGQSTRRTFLSRLGMASLLASAAPIAHAFEEHSEKAQVTSTDLKDAIPVVAPCERKEVRSCESIRARRFSIVFANICI